MNTIFSIITEEQITLAPFTDIRAKWKALSDNRLIKKQDMVALCIYRSMVANEDKDAAIKRLRKSFTPISNPSKLYNGSRPYYGLKSARQLIGKSELIKWLTIDESVLFISILEEINISVDSIS